MKRLRRHYHRARIWVRELLFVARQWLLRRLYQFATWLQARSNAMQLWAYAHLDPISAGELEDRYAQPLIDRHGGWEW